jgi:DNA-binding winged helix-turn-helix (wHTH) protein
MESDTQSHLLRFEDFELDLRTRELRQQSRLIKLQDLPVRLLILLATRAGELVTREEIEQELWGEDHFVDFDHGINTAMRKVREALGESTETPRLIETLPRKGYRFLAEVQRCGAIVPPSSRRTIIRDEPDEAVDAEPDQIVNEQGTLSAVGPMDSPAPDTPVATPQPLGGEEEFALPTGPSRQLFLLTQAGYLVLYCVTLFKLEQATGVLERFFSISSDASLPILIALALCGIAVRLFLLTSVGLRHPSAGVKYRRLFPVLLLLDVLWAASPLLLVEKIGVGLSMAGIAGLAYLPFSQRILMNSIYPGK